jgi:hypothetical protein
MPINLAGLKEIGRRNPTGTTIITFIADGDNPRASLLALLRQLPAPGNSRCAEVTSIEVGPGDCYHEVRRAKVGLERMRYCHGCSGTWQPCSEEEAVDWLLPGLEAATANPRIRPAILTLPWQNYPFKLT